MSDGESAYVPRCKNLCCKSMMVFGEDFQNDPDFQAGFADFWCVQTSKAQGPDSADVSWEACTNPQRECFQEY